MLQRCRTFDKIWKKIWNFPYFPIFVTKFYHLLVMLMNLICFVIENLSYNWSIITYQNSNTNAVEVFNCIKRINENEMCILDAHFFFYLIKKKTGDIRFPVLSSTLLVPLMITRKNP